MTRHSDHTCGGSCGLGGDYSGVSRRQFLVGVGALAVGSAAGRALAADAGQTYAGAVLSHESLRGYWRLDGDLADATGKAAAKATGKVQFAEGAVDGRAANLVPNQAVTVSKTGHLVSPAASLELFFRLSAKPVGDQDPVIIAQTSRNNIRFIIGIRRDLSALTFTEGRVPTTVHLPTAQLVEVGRWYHLVVTSNMLDLRVYVDGHECALTGGALDFTRRARGTPPITFGARDAKGRHQTPILLDEVAYFAEGLSLAQIQKHLTAGGWGDRLKQTGRAVKRLEADRRKTRKEQLQKMLRDPALTARGERRVYRNEHLEAVAFTVGGIGAGAIQFNGKGEPAIWQIAGNHHQPRVPHSFLAVRAQRSSGKSVVRTLQTEPVGPFQAMRSLSLQGEYPFVWYHFEAPALPVDLELEVFSPFIPLDAKSSAIPCAVYTVKAKNAGKKPVQVDVLASQQNAIGYADARGVINGRRFGGYGGNGNRIVRERGATMLHMTRSGQSGKSADMVLATRADGVSSVASWGSLETLHKTFSTSGTLKGRDKAGPSGKSRTVDGALSAPLALAPGESKSVTFVLTWYFPNIIHGQPRGPWRRAGNMYTNWWASAIDVARHVTGMLDDLTARTRRFHQTLYDSNLPRWLLDRLSSQLAVLRSRTCWWAADGYFGVWEGCAPDSGCCGGNCTHVWHYAQAHARLQPEIARRMREQDFDQQRPNGLTPFRHIFARAAADGHFGTILNAYREHLCSRDDKWLKKLWPKIKKAMEWGIRTWDPNRDGFLQNVQHNTLDGEMAGCSSWIGTLYLSALEATAIMAETMGDAQRAASYRKIRTSGMKLQNQRLFNGEYYIQVPGEKRIEDYLDGCHIDQVLGEWWADMVSLPRNYPRPRVRKALEALLKHNFYTNFHGQSLKPRQFVTSDDAGMKMITWPRGPQPIPGMKYGDEVMTGFEYGAGVSMLQNGMLREGLMVIKAIYERYDGRLRTQGITNMATGAWGYTGNPFGDDECGKYYGRSLSVWSALLALQGFVYDGPAGRIGFAPRWQPKDHASFFTAAEGYGLFVQKRNGNRQTASIALREGRLQLAEVQLTLADGKKPAAVDVSLADESIDVKFAMKYGTLRLTFKRPIVLASGQRLDIQVKTA